MLIKCTECQEEFSEKFQVCPKCEFPMSVSIEKEKNKKQERTNEIVQKIISYLCSEKI